MVAGEWRREARESSRANADRLKNYPFLGNNKELIIIM